MSKYLIVVYNYDRCEPHHYESTSRDSMKAARMYGSHMGKEEITILDSKCRVLSRVVYSTEKRDYVRGTVEEWEKKCL